MVWNEDGDNSVELTGKWWIDELPVVDKYTYF